MSTSTYLFARPSFGAGFARATDLFGVFDTFNESPNSAVADARAIRADWLAVGDDMRAAALQWAAANGIS